MFSRPPRPQFTFQPRHTSSYQWMTETAIPRRSKGIVVQQAQCSVSTPTRHDVYTQTLGLELCCRVPHGERHRALPFAAVSAVASLDPDVFEDNKLADFATSSSLPFPPGESGESETGSSAAASSTYPAPRHLSVCTGARRPFTRCGVRREERERTIYRQVNIGHKPF